MLILVTTMLQFGTPLFLYVLLAIPLQWILFVYIKHRTRKQHLALGGTRVLKRLLPNFSTARLRNEFLAISVITVLIVLALADPRLPDKQELVQRSGTDLVIALDVSRSMLAEDVLPSRLEKARQLISLLLDELPNDRFGLVVFAGKAYVQFPVTSDHQAAKLFLAGISTEIVPVQGTVLAQALHMSNSAFNQAEKKYRSVLLITDGEDHEEDALTAARQLASSGILLNTIGIGSKSGANILDEKTGELRKDEEGNPIVTQLNEPLLQQLALAGGGIYQRGDQSLKVLIDGIKKQVSLLGSRVYSDKLGVTSYIHFFPYLIAIAVLLLVLLFLQPIWKIKRGMLVAGAAFSLNLFCNPALQAQSYTQAMHEGNKAYRSGKMLEAVSSYAKAVAAAPKNHKAWFNQGNAQFKCGKKTEAVQSWKKSLELSSSGSERSSAFYNLGVLAQQDGKIEQAMDYYKQALRSNAANADARHNLQLLLKEQKNQSKPKPQPRPTPQQSKAQQQKQPSEPFRQKEAADRLKALDQKERNLQSRMHKQQDPGIQSRKKDW